MDGLGEAVRCGHTATHRPALFATFITDRNLAKRTSIRPQHRRTPIFNTRFNQSLTLDNATVNGNTATTGNGGGIYSLSTLSATDTSINNNSATAGDGGGIYNSAIFHAASVTFDTSVTVRSNTALSGGGVFNTDGGTYTIPAGDVFGNAVGDIVG